MDALGRLEGGGGLRQLLFRFGPGGAFDLDEFFELLESVSLIGSRVE
jgi:hypothetical protein